jgi:hypothetical protein
LLPAESGDGTAVVLDQLQFHLMPSGQVACEASCTRARTTSQSGIEDLRSIDVDPQPVVIASAEVVGPDGTEIERSNPANRKVVSVDAGTRTAGGVDVYGRGLTTLQDRRA